MKITGSPEGGVTGDIMSTLSKRRLPLHQEREVAVAASVDPRTVRRVMAGEPVRIMARERVERALRKLGIVLEARSPVADIEEPSKGGQP